MSTQSAQTMQYKNKSSGFTLIELMVVIVIIGILASIAIPSYRDYVIRSRIQEATGTLSDLRTRMEQYYQDNRNYGTANGANQCGNGTPTIRFPMTNAVGTMPKSKDFNFTCATAAAGAINAQTYIITATGVGSVANFVYTINEQNLKTSTISAGAPASWISTNANCWRGGGC
jgi:type IV pilus assembly protein PilE